MRVECLGEALVTKHNVEIFIGINECARHVLQRDPKLGFLLGQGENGELLNGEIAIARLRPSRRAASIGGFDRGGALFERIDLVNQLRFRLAKAPLPVSGSTGNMPLLANRHYLGRFLAEEPGMSGADDDGGDSANWTCSLIRRIE